MTISGPLSGVVVVEFQALGPAPFCGMVLADLGARVIRIERGQRLSSGSATLGVDFLSRGRDSIILDLKSPDGVKIALELIGSADVLIEGYRPGVMERLGLGPDVATECNPRLVYGRVTGFGQEGPIASAAGHDINYLALAGCLAHIGLPEGPPLPPLNLVGDFGGGGMLLAVGVLAALLEARASGIGQVIDAAMVDGAALLMTSLCAPGTLSARGTNVPDGGSHFYGAYECADKQYISIASAEPQFYAILRDLLGLTDPKWDAQMDRDQWPALKAELAEIFRSKTRAEWCELLEGSDACFAAVLSLSEAPLHPHNKARRTFLDIDGFTQPAPAPRFSRTSCSEPSLPAAPGSSTTSILGDLGYTQQQVAALLDRRIAQASA